MPPSSLPRQPRKEERPGTKKYNDIVCSGRIRLQHKASCYHGHGYSNRLSSLQGCTSVIPHARISRLAYTLLGNAPPRLSDTPKSILRALSSVCDGRCHRDGKREGKTRGRECRWCRNRVQHKHGDGHHDVPRFGALLRDKTPTPACLFYMNENWNYNNCYLTAQGKVRVVVGQTLSCFPKV